MEIRTLGPGDEDAVAAAAPLFDGPPDAAATRRFLDEPGHHLLVAYDDDRPVGFVSGVEMVHPDKGAEMFLYELGVDEPARRQGIGRALVDALAAVARERGCYAMWTGTDDDNVPALRTYLSAGAALAPTVTVEWRF